MPSNVIINFMTTQHKSSAGVTASFPDVCKTPAPPAPSPVPIPYPNVGNSSMASVKVTKRVKDNKQKVVIKGAAYSMTSGDEPGVALGIVSNKIKGKSEVMNTSFNVKFEGKGVGRLSDPHGNNSGSKPNVPCPAQAQPPNFATTAQKAEMENACKQVRDQCGVDPKDRDKVAAECGMAPEHAESIRQTCQATGHSATFRSTNPKCMDKIRAGYPAKGCDIKQKTITGDRASSAPEGVRNAVQGHDMEGFVGHYDDNGVLQGVMTTDGPVPFSDTMPPPPHNTYTGDYDAHDMFGPGGQRITDGSEAEERFSRNLNSAIGRNDGEVGPRNDMVRHGPQNNYADFCKNNNIPKDKQVPQLKLPDVSPDEPLLAFDENGHMYKIENEDQLRAYYKCKGQDVPPEWDPPKREKLEAEIAANKKKPKGMSSRK